MKLTRRNLMIGAAATGIVTAFPASATQVLGGPAFGSTWRLVMPKSRDTSAVVKTITSIEHEIDALMSPWRATSEISRFNSAKSTSWMPLSPQTCAVLAESRIVADMTDGAFEPGIGPVVNRYGFGPISGTTGTLADLRLVNNSAQKMKPDLTLDLCGIAKGYALDRIVLALKSLQIEDFLIELGGEVHSSGRHPDGRAWNVGIERPGCQLAFQRIIAPGKLALATSGTNQNGHRDKSRQFSHLIDPNKTRPVNNNIYSVSVLAPTAMRADALATALMIMGPNTGSEFANSHGISALFLIGDDPEFSEIVAGKFADHILA